MNKLHLVFGGRVSDPQTLDFSEPEKLDVVGIYPNSTAGEEERHRKASHRKG